jgi:hypothetical protein
MAARFVLGKFSGVGVVSVGLPLRCHYGVFAYFIVITSTIFQDIPRGTHIGYNGALYMVCNGVAVVCTVCITSFSMLLYHFANPPSFNMVTNNQHSISD